MGNNDRKQPLAEHKAAKQHLEQVSKRDKTESEDVLAANARVAETEQSVPWHRR